MAKKVIILASFLILILSINSCTSIYFNTFHNINKNFNGAEKNRKKAGRDLATGGEIKMYNDAIAKASRVLERHPTSSWIDDALYIIGTSYYYLGDYSKSSRKFKELLANYPESKYIPQSRVLLAKAKLKQKEETEAIVLFEEIFEKSEDNRLKADAARALGEYYFENKNYEKANSYFQSLIDSLGEETDRLHALTYVGDAYFENYKFSEALQSYESALDQNPDSLQYYRITFRMAECDYFLFNIESGLKKLESLANKEIYYDSLAPIRLKMAEGYEWEGGLEDAINTYEQIAVENPRKEAAAIAYYELALIYQFDLEDYPKAQAYYAQARDENRRSSIYADAVRRASQLALLEQFTTDDNQEIDSAQELSIGIIDTMSSNQFRLGELYYYDLDKPDSALKAYQEILDRFPKSKYAPQALMSMAYIHEAELFDTAASDSLLRLVLSEYADYDEAEIVIDKLGLAGTVADSGYAALVFKRGEELLEQFHDLEKEWYFPFEMRIERTIDSTDTASIIVDTSSAGEIVDTSSADEIADTTDGIIDTTAIINPMASEDTSSSSVFVPDTNLSDSSVFVPDTNLSDNQPQTGKEHMRLSDLMSQAQSGDMASQETGQDLDSAVIDSMTAKIINDSTQLPDSVPDTALLDKQPPGFPEYSTDTVKQIVQKDSTEFDSLLSQSQSYDSGNADEFDSLLSQSQSYDSGNADTASQMMEDEKASELKHGIDKGNRDDRDDRFGRDAIGDTSLSQRDIKPGSKISSRELAEGLDTSNIGTSESTEDSPDSLSIDSLPTSYFGDDKPLDTVPRTEEYYSALGTLDSARYYFQYVVDSFPLSKYSVQSRYMLLWTYDKYFAPGDSLLIDLYAAFVDSFPETEYTSYIGKEYNIRPSPGVMQRMKKEKEEKEETAPPPEDETEEESQFADSSAIDTTSTVSKFVIGPNGEQLSQANKYFSAENVKFIYPLEAVAARIEDLLYFQILIDFNGEVKKAVLQNPTASDELNELILETVKRTIFDYSSIPPELYDSWFYYTKEVKVPSGLRQ